MSWSSELFGKIVSLRAGNPPPQNSALTALARVTARVTINGNPEDPKVPAPLLTLEEFFDGNFEIGSIGCNLIDIPKPAEVYALLRKIRSREDVSDVRVQITCLDDPGKQWPFSDCVWIMTSADPETVEFWFPEHLAPDECWSGWGEHRPYEPVEVETGHHPVGVWFD